MKQGVTGERIERLCTGARAFANHGRKRRLEEFRGSEQLAVFRAVKRHFDPEGVIPR